MTNSSILGRVGVLFLIGFATTPTICAEDWPNWRGPNHDGSTTETNLPADISDPKSIVWSTDMPGSSSATPAIFGNRVFVTSNDASLTSLYGLCLDRDSGKILWKKQLAEVARQPARNTMASPSPVTDGERVYFLFGTSDFTALTLDGDIVWSKNLDRELGPIGQQFAYSSSPLLYKGRLYLAILRGQWQSGGNRMSYSDKDSHVVCLDPATGDVLWKVHRPSDARGESFDSYASPIPYDAGENGTVVIQGGDSVTGHDPLTGKELWRHPHNARHINNWRVVPTPVVAGNLVCATLPRGGAVFAISPIANTRMVYEDAKWVYNQRTTDVPSPAYYDGRIYVVNGTEKSLTCLDPATGTEVWKGDLGSYRRIWASPTFGDGKAYCIDESGQVTVAAVGKTFKVLSRVELGGSPAKSSISIANGRLFVRTADKLYCIGS